MAAAITIASCGRGGEPTPDTPSTGTDSAITLPCNYFSTNPNAVLKDNPNADIDYIITCNGMSIPDDVTIEPGVTIAFETDASLWIREDGSLKAVGTSDKPITFTGVDKARGAWGGIFFASNDPKNEMKYTIVEYSGGTASAWSSSEKAGVVIGSGASLKFENNLVQLCKAWGLSLFYSANASNTTIKNNTFKENEVPIQISSPFIGLVEGNNAFIDNIVNKVEVKTEYPIANAQTIHKLSVPYSVTNGTNDFRVGVDGALTIEPGTVIEMGAGKGIFVTGSINAVGTASEKIVIRGALAAPGSWEKIALQSTTSPNNILRHVEVKHAGAGANATTTDYAKKGAIVLTYNPRLLIEDCLFEDIQSCVLSSHGGTGNLTLGANITKVNVNTAGIDECEF